MESATAARHSREVERQGWLPVSTKLLQALGALPGALKDWAFATFLL